MVLCTRKGCGKQFDLDNNAPDSCQFHPGAPVFHEGLKGWGCCTKRELDFSAFLSIPGCATGPHSDIKPEKVEPLAKAPETGDSNPSPQPDVSSSGIETYTMSEVKQALPPLPKVEDSKVAAKAKEEQEVRKEDDPTISVSPGVVCKRRGCGYKFVTDEVSRGSGLENNCDFHPGAPVFHEGSKGWSCCKRKVLEFDEFLKIKGCKNSKHFFAEKISEEPKIELTDCRFDWYQSPSQIILSIFAKKANKDSTKLEFKNNELSVNIEFLGNKLFKKTFILSQLIEPESCKFEVLGSKVEIILKKANGVAWATLEQSDKITTWTTFGSGDSPLTNS